MTTRTIKRRKRSENLPEVAADFSFSEIDVRGVSNRLSEPKWLRDRRLGAWETYQAIPMPSRTDETWRRTDLRGLPSTTVGLKSAPNGAIDPEMLKPIIGREEASLMILQPGEETQVRGSEGFAGQGVVFCDWATAVNDHADLLKEHLGKVVGVEEGKFAALAAAMAEDGILVYIPPGVVLEVPLHAVLWAPGGGRATFSRMLVVVGQGAQATLVYEAASPSEEGQSFHAGLVEIKVAEGARLTFVELQNWGKHVWNITHERAQLYGDAELDWIYGAVGSHLTKNFTEIDLAGQGAQGRLSGFYFADGSQHLDHDTQQNHRAPATTSDLLFKGALVDSSRSVWQGMIYVAPGAQGTDGYQANRNLILSKEARADSIPGLEILADDVRCSHGATVGQLEEEPIFYLMSRGLPRQEAERLVVDGFFQPIMDRIPYPGVRERFRRMIELKRG